MCAVPHTCDLRTSELGEHPILAIYKHSTTRQLQGYLRAIVNALRGAPIFVKCHSSLDGVELVFARHHSSINPTNELTLALTHACTLEQVTAAIV